MPFFPQAFHSFAWVCIEIKSLRQHLYTFHCFHFFLSFLFSFSYHFPAVIDLLLGWFLFKNFRELTLGARGFFLVGGDRIERQSHEGKSRSGDKHYALWCSSPLVREKTSGIQGTKNWKHHQDRQFLPGSSSDRKFHSQFFTQISEHFCAYFKLHWADHSTLGVIGNIFSSCRSWA